MADAELLKSVAIASLLVLALGVPFIMDWRTHRRRRRSVDPDQQRRETLRKLAAADYARRTRPAGKDGR